VRGLFDVPWEGGHNGGPVSAGATPEINVHSTEFPFLQPYNLRAQMFMALRNDLGAGIIGGVGVEGNKCEFWKDGQVYPMLSDELRKEIGWIEYKIPDGKKLRILKKKEMKKKNGKSPDIGDGAAIANWMRRKEFSGFSQLF